jgi:MOB kinase activator 1
VDFFNQINLLYGSIAEFCTSSNCEIMSAGPKYEYLWADETTKKPIRCSAPEYMDHVMTWVQTILDEDSVFPSRIDQPFPKTFRDTVKNIFKRLFRIYAHIYYSHFQKIVSLGEEAHLNTCFKHFYFFIVEFSLVDKREMAPLEELINSLVNQKDKEVTGLKGPSSSTNNSSSSPTTKPSATPTNKSIANNNTPTQSSPLSPKQTKPSPLKKP